MTKRPKNKSARHAHEDDLALWRQVAQSTVPIAPRVRGRTRILDRQTDHATLSKESGLGERRASHPARDQVGTSVPADRKQHINRAAEKVQNVPAPGGLGQSQTRRLRSGRTRIEARLDLHGMRQSEAHGALKHFLFAAHRRGLRWVLVITGKGGRQRQDADGGTFDGTGRYAEFGVLRRNVPLWLSEPDLSALVTGFHQAAPQHGGEGALYINLRRRQKV